MGKLLKIFFVLFLLFNLSGPAYASLNLSGSVLRVVVKTQNFLKKKEFDKAEETLTKYIKNHGKGHFIIHFLLANILAGKGETKNAVNHYKKSAELNGKYAPTFQNLGTAYFKMKRYKTAADTMLKSYNLSENRNYQILYFASVSYILAEKPLIAKEHLFFLTSGKAGPPKAEWLKSAFKLTIKLELYDKAEELIEKLVLIEKNNSKLWRLITWFHLKRKHYKKALTAFKIYAYLSPIKNDSDMKLMGDLYSCLGLTDAAAECYEKMDKKNYKKIVEAYINSSRKDKAVKAADSAIGKKCDPEICFLKGVLHFEKYEYDKAFDSFSKCTEQTKNNGKAYLLLGYCAIKTEKFKEAEIALKKAMKFKNERKKAKDLLKQTAVLISSKEENTRK